MCKKNGHLIAHVIYISLYAILILSTIIFHNSANLVLYSGLLLLPLAIVFIFCSSRSRKKKSINGNKESLIEGGMYALVRHPEFLGHMIIVSALIAISQHWTSFIIGAILITLLYLAAIEEEKRNIEKFGNVYKEYMKKVPRLNILIGIMRRIHK